MGHRWRRHNGHFNRFEPSGILVASSPGWFYRVKSIPDSGLLFLNLHRVVGETHSHSGRGNDAVQSLKGVFHGPSPGVLNRRSCLICPGYVFFHGTGTRRAHAADLTSCAKGKYLLILDLNNSFKQGPHKIFVGSQALNTRWSWTVLI